MFDTHNVIHDTPYGTHDTRRLKIIYVPEREIFEYFVMGLRAGTGQRPADVISLPCFPSDRVPRDAKLVGGNVKYDMQRRAFGFVIAHESFPEVPDGEVIPEAVAAMDECVVAVQVPQDEFPNHPKDEAGRFIKEATPAEYAFDLMELRYEPLQLTEEERERQAKLKEWMDREIERLICGNRITDELVVGPEPEHSKDKAGRFVPKAPDPQIDNMYICEKCDLRFDRRQFYLDSHVDLHCPKCGTMFVRKSRFNELQSIVNSQWENYWGNHRPGTVAEEVDKAMKSLKATQTNSNESQVRQITLDGHCSQCDRLIQDEISTGNRLTCACGNILFDQVSFLVTGAKGKWRNYFCKQNSKKQTNPESREQVARITNVSEGTIYPSRFIKLDKASMDASEITEQSADQPVNSTPTQSACACPITALLGHGHLPGCPERKVE